MAIRLIDTDTLELKSFVESDVPKYAILSHTWGPEADEVTFQDMLAMNRGSENPKRERPGYLKIIETCRKARLTGIGYCWVDTCCIDKTSSAELSEAINSMFKWYRDAAVCYVLLSDFEIGDTRDMTSISGSRWFKRGWCLQELVAPRHVEFFDRLWSFLGTREELSSRISKITAIATNVLTGQVSMDTLPIAQRLAWAAKRETTRTEDIAYCLLGIFDIQMPILYGEGTKAFIRLQEEIMKQSNDRSLFASRQPGVRERYCSLLAPSPRYFAHCANLVHTESHVYQGSAYALTNRGLQYSETELYIDYLSGLYVLPLSCISSPDAEVIEGLLLEQVGPNLFARLSQRPRVDIVHQIRFKRKVPSFVKKGIHIASHVTPSIHADMLLADEYSIQVSSDTLRLDHPYALQIEDEIAGSHRWDIAGLRFLTRGHPNFRGYWKVNVEQALSLSDRYLVRDMEKQYCYLSCGFEWRDRTKGRTSEPWVFLYTESFQKQYNGTGIVPSPFLQLSGQKSLATSRLYLGRHRYTRVYLDASIKVDEQPRKYRLKFNLTEAG